MMRSRPDCRTGFTLLEMSIAIIIVGFLISFTIFGMELVHQSTLKRVMESKVVLDAQVKLFQTRYSALPGDYANYDNMISGITAGNQNGVLGYLTTASGVWDEVNNFYVHLSAADMINGNYSVANIGRTGAPYTWNPGTNAPRGAIGSSVLWAGTHDVTLYGRAGLKQNFYWLTGADIRSGALSLEDTLSIDNKYDDGKADTGMVRAYRPWDGVGGSNNCVSAVRTAGSASYLGANEVENSSAIDCIVELGPL